MFKTNLSTMDIIRKLGKSIVGILISFMLISILSINLSMSFLNEDFIKESIKTVYSGEYTNISESDFQIMLETYCKNFDTIDFQGVNISCGEISGKNTSEVMDIIFSKLSENFFNREIECEIIECFKQGRYEALFSKKTKVFLLEVQNYLIPLFILLALLFLVLCKSFEERFKSLGYIVLASVVPMLAMNYVLPSIISSYIPKEMMELQSIFAMRINEFSLNLWILTIIALISILFGVILKSEK